MLEDLTVVVRACSMQEHKVLSRVPATDSKLDYVTLALVHFGVGGCCGWRSGGKRRDSFAYCLMVSPVIVVFDWGIWAKQKLPAGGYADQNRRSL
jgi:hypothetical protein